MNNKFFRFMGGKTVLIPIFLFFIAGISYYFGLLPAKAEDWAIIDVIPADRSAKLSFASPDGLANLMIAAGTSTADSSFKFMRYLPAAEVAIKYPNTEIVPAGDLYYLELAPNTVEYSSRPRITVKFNHENKLKSLYYFNEADQQFVKLSATRDTKKNTLTFEAPITKELIFGLFEEPAQTGTASWYVHPRYKKELMAASTDFSFGSKVKVTNLDNGKEVIVTIKDYGPDKSVHPDRVVDLGKEAFKKIASTRAGVIKVKVEPVVTSTAAANPVASNSKK